MSTSHDHKPFVLCQHTELKYCSHCDVAYCVACGREWPSYKYNKTYTTPWYQQPYLTPFISAGGGAGGNYTSPTLQKTEAVYNSTHNHE